MTEFRTTARAEDVAARLRPTPGRRSVWAPGLAGLGLGAVLTVLAVFLANGVLGFLSLVVVFGSVVWLAVGLLRHYAARYRRS